MEQLIRFRGLKNALEEALTSCFSMKPAAAEGSSDPIQAAIPSMPTPLAQQTADRLRNAADMGNITELKIIAADMRSRAEIDGTFSDNIERMAEDFDLDGILRLADELEKKTDE